MSNFNKSTFEIRILFGQLFIILFLNLYASKLIGQYKIDTFSYQSMSFSERLNYIHQIPFGKMDSATIRTITSTLIPWSIRSHDARSYFASKYYYFQARGKLNLDKAEILAVLAEMENKATDFNLKMEEAIANHYFIFEAFNLKQISPEEMYSEAILDGYSIERIGIENFKDYDVARICFHLGKIMYSFEDFDRSLKYLLISEEWMKPNIGATEIYILVLNYIQSIYQKREEFEKAINYAQRIIEFCKSHYSGDSSYARAWLGLASIDMAAMCIKQNKYHEAEVYANQGYSCVFDNKLQSNLIVSAEFSALMVLIDINLETRALAQSKRFLERAHYLDCYLDNSETRYFDRIRLFELNAKYCELVRNFECAVHYNNLAKPYKDSLEKRNNIRTFKNIELRLLSNDFQEKIDLIQSEKKLQKWLMYSVFCILILICSLFYLNFLRKNAHLKQIVSSFNSTKAELSHFVSLVKEKSELTDVLNSELEKYISADERKIIIETLSRSTILKDQDWTEFRILFERVYPDFIKEIQDQYPGITLAETRILVLDKLNMTTQEMANTLGVQKNTINQTWLRLRKKDTKSNHFDSELV